MKCCKECEKLKKEALKRFKKIYPCIGHNNFNKCFTYYKGKLFFWFNTEDKSTHILHTEINGEVVI